MLRTLPFMRILTALAVFAFNLFVLTYRLQSNPPGFFIDESIYGFEAYTLLKTKGFSSSGEFLPRLFDHGYGLWGHGLYTYLVMPFIGLFGMKEASVRIASILSSITLLCVLCVFLKNRVQGWSILLMALWWPLTSWVFLLSRIGMEMMTFALISTLALWTLVKNYESKTIQNRHLFWFDVLLVILFFVYAAGKVMAAGYMLLALVVLVRKRAPVRHIFKIGLAVVVILLLSLPYVQDGTFLYRANELSIKCATNAWQCLVKNLASHFSYSSYFANSYIPPDFDVPTHSISGTSLIPRALSLFVLIGLLVWLHQLIRKDFFAVLILACLVLGIIPASLTIRGFDSYRSIALLPIVFIAIALGLDACVKITKKHPPWLQVVSLVVALGATIHFGYDEIKTMFDYEYKERVAIDWHYGYPQIQECFLKHYQEYDALIVTETIAYVPNQYIRFYDPDSRYTKIKVGKLAEIDGNPRILFAGRSWEVDLTKFTVYKSVYFPDGHGIAFYIGEPVPSEIEE